MAKFGIAAAFALATIPFPSSAKDLTADDVIAVELTAVTETKEVTITAERGIARARLTQCEGTWAAGTWLMAKVEDSYLMVNAADFDVALRVAGDKALETLIELDRVCVPVQL